MSSSPDDFDDELLSAYVDDELTADERAQVEERLRTDPRSVALVEELRTLSSAVKSLPRETLPRDLRAAVLADVGRGDERDSEPAAISLATAEDRRAGLRRGLFWSALAIAATLLLVVAQPQQKEDGAVARRRGNLDRKQEQLRPASPSPRDAERPVRFSQESPALRAPAAAVSGVAAEDVAEDRAGANGGGLGGGAGEVGEHAGRATTDAFAATDEAAEKTPLAKEREMAPQANVPRQGGASELSLRAGKPAGTPERVDRLEDRDEGVATFFGAERTLSADGKDVRKAAVAPRVLVITTARLDAVSHFKQWLKENKLAVTSDKSPAPAAAATAAPVQLGAQLERAAPVEILVDASPEEVEHLLALCRADKAFAEVPASRQKNKSAALYAAAPPAEEFPADSARSLADAESKSSALNAQAADSSQAAPEAAKVAPKKEDIAKSNESRARSYGAEAAAGRRVLRIK